MVPTPTLQDKIMGKFDTLIGVCVLLNLAAEHWDFGGWLQEIRNLSPKNPGMWYDGHVSTVQPDLVLLVATMLSRYGSENSCDSHGRRFRDLPGESNDVSSKTVRERKWTCLKCFFTSHVEVPKFNNWVVIIVVFHFHGNNSTYLNVHPS